MPVEYPPPPINTGFVQDYQNAMLYGTYSFGDAPGDPRTIMTCYTPAQTPVLSALARGFAVCDHYHCSVPSQTSRIATSSTPRPRPATSTTTRSPPASADHLQPAAGRDRRGPDRPELGRVRQ